MELVLAFINGIAGLVAAIGALLAGVAAMLNAWRKRGERRRKSMRNSRVTEKTLWAIGVGLISISVAMFAVRAGQEAQPKNVELTTAAWNALNAKDYALAIAKAQECIAEFRVSADREQAELEKQMAPLPPKGKVTEAERQAIFARGLLNDVATCYFIVGRSAEYLGRKELSQEAYGNAARYTYARTWDPKGWFWSPAEAAQDRLRGLR